MIVDPLQRQQLQAGVRILSKAGWFQELMVSICEAGFRWDLVKKASIARDLVIWEAHEAKWSNPAGVMAMIIVLIIGHPHNFLRLVFSL